MPRHDARYMKSTPSAIGALLLAALSLPGTGRAEFTVHEWGTFTILHDSTGTALKWYLSSYDQHALPGFVHQAGAGGSARFMKATTPEGFATARMETPVVYFYPDDEMNISVSASLPAGRLTEWFPDALRAGNPLLPGNTLQWIGRLLPPSSPLAADIPRTKDSAGLHYDAARAVPDAWIYRSSLPNPEPRLDPKDPTKTLPRVPELDRVLFYRGAADFGAPLIVSTADDRVFALSNVCGNPISAAFAVQATAQGIAWARVDGIQPVQWVDGKQLNVKNFTFPDARPREESIAALRKAVTETLVTEGLTPAEAAAMVETWKDLWFAETGTRILSVLPEEWVAGTVPLSINPVPAKMDRVYVLRSEILTKAREEGLADLLAGSGDPATDTARFKALELGRFMHGALPRAKSILSSRQDARFYTWLNGK